MTHAEELKILAAAATQYADLDRSPWSGLCEEAQEVVRLMNAVDLMEVERLFGEQHICNVPRGTDARSALCVAATLHYFGAMMTAGARLLAVELLAMLSL